MTITKTAQRRAERLIEIARALQGTKRTGQHFHVTFILFKKKILSIGINDYRRDHPAHKFGSYKPARTSSKDIAYRAGIHSEIDALQRLAKEDQSGLEFWNIHIRRDGSLGCSKPCMNCTRVLNDIDIKRLYYWDKDVTLRVV